MSSKLKSRCASRNMTSNYSILQDLPLVNTLIHTMQNRTKRRLTTSLLGNSMPMVSLLHPTILQNQIRPRTITSFQLKQRPLFLKTSLSSPLRELDKSHNCLKFVAAKKYLSTSKSSTSTLI